MGLLEHNFNSIYWTAKEMIRVIAKFDPKAADIDLSLMEHIRSIEWDNLVLYEHIVIDKQRIKR
jgi:hypothetical protein